MYALRGIVISLSLFIVLYCATSCAVLLSWRKMCSFSQRFSAGLRADVLFGIRMLPAIAAAALIAAYAVPSFVAFEPRALQETINGISIGLSAVGLAFLVFGLGRSGAALRRARRVIAEWMRGAEILGIGHSVAVLEVSGHAPAMTAAGIARPRILLSHSARSLLSPNELHAALNHEWVHVRRRDNLKKLLLHVVAFPGMKSLESAWIEAAEMTADENAVSNSSEALDLASALIKLSHLAVPTPAAELAAALVHSPASLVDARVKRLIAWKEQTGTPRPYAFWWSVCAAGVALCVLVFSYAPMLVRVHAMTEWMVR